MILKFCYWNFFSFTSCAEKVYSKWCFKFGKIQQNIFIHFIYVSVIVEKINKT